MTTIPDDIMEAAEQTLYAVHSDDDPAFGARLIARAILAERERCEEMEQERIDRLDSAANIFRYEVDALRSVSARHKLSMIRAKHDAVNKARQRHWWETDLNRLREGKTE